MKQVKLIVIACITVSLFACSTEASFKASQQLTSPYITKAQAQRDNDSDLADRLNKILSDQVPTNRLKVVVNNNDVLLVGQVQSQNDSLQAESICKKWPGTDKVFNYLTVNDNPGLHTSYFMASDAKSKASAFYDVNVENMDFVAVDNVIYVLGTNIGNLTSLNTAIERMYNIPNVTKVVNLEQDGADDYTAQK